ncbi:hypothetical protein DESA109040_22085 [Deinococcus saxicola]|uniref:hypothetical protein n=1 Tax=Deinococcus saxicola TaxID=249406 RepID=UPI0039EE2293
MTERLSHYRSRAAWALVLLYDEKTREFLGVWQQAKAANVRRPASAVEHTQLHGQLLRHVLASSDAYMVRICTHLGLPDPKLDLFTLSKP